MSWRETTIWTWTCDLCEQEHTSSDDLQPEGWTHDMVGHDRCPRCADVPCGCDDGECRVGR